MKINIINEYIISGIDYILCNSDSSYIKYIIDYTKIPTVLLSKIYKYMIFSNKIENKNIKISPYLSLEKRYYIFGLFGLVSIFSVKKVRKEIPFYDDMIKELSDIPELTGDYEKDLQLYIDFNNKLLEYNSPTRNVMLTFIIVFRKEIINFNNIYLRKFMK